MRLTKEGKTTSWEGGQRVPFIIRWPGNTPEGTVCNKLVCAIDILPTLAAITNGRLSDNKIDGVDITSLWKGDFESTPRETILYYFGKNNLNGMRKVNWKLVLHTLINPITQNQATTGMMEKRLKQL